jgi:hypothetical protein
MLNPVSANDLIHLQQQEFKAQDNSSSEIADKGTASESAASDDNPAKHEAAARLNQKLEGSDQSQRNTVSPTKMINTANETMKNQVVQAQMFDEQQPKEDAIGMPDKGNIGADYDHSGEKSVFEKVADANPLTQTESSANEESVNELFNSSMAPVANDEKFGASEYQPQVQTMAEPVKALDEQMSQIKAIQVEAAEVPDRVKGNDDNKWDSAKVQELANSVSDEMSSAGGSAMKAQANISPEQTMAMLR